MLKSFFISVFPVLCLVGLAISVDQYLHNYILAAIGLALVSVPMLLFLSKLFLFDTPRTSSGLNTYSIVVLTGTLILVFSFYAKEAELMSIVGFVIVLFWFLYIKWYSVFGDRTNAILKKGNMLPVMKFENSNGNIISSDEFIGMKNIFMFYRGNWCPLCVAQIKELASSYKDLESRGIQTILISPQPHKNTRSISEKFDVGFKYLIDKDNAVAKQLNIFSKHGLPAGLQVLGYDSDTVLPTVILTDVRGRIVHVDLTSNYRVRPGPSELIKYFA